MHGFLQHIDWPRLKKSIDRSLCKLAFLALAVLVLGHTLGVALWEWIKPSFPWYVRLAAGLALFLFSSAWLRVHRFKKSTGNFLAFTLALTGGHWIALDFHHLLGHALHMPKWGIILIAVVGFIYFLDKLHHARHSWRGWVTFGRSPAQERVQHSPIAHLVIFLSPPTTVPRIDGETGGISFKKSETEWLELDASLDTAIKQMDALTPPHNWQQSLRSILPHAANLTSLWIVVSGPPNGKVAKAAEPGTRPRNADGSAPYQATAQTLFRRYLPSTTEINFSNPLDFEDFRPLEHYLRDKILHSLPPNSSRSTAIDITGGFKVSSALGSLLTVNDEAVFQYVQTVAADNGTGPEAQIYDVRNDGGPEIPG